MCACAVLCPIVLMLRHFEQRKKKKQKAKNNCSLFFLFEVKLSAISSGHQRITGAVHLWCELVLYI